MKRLHLAIYSASAAILAAEFGLTAYFWNVLPARIPTHFNLAGSPNAYSAKSLPIVFLIPLIQLVIYLLFILLYRYPQYTNWPTTLILVTVEEKKREKIYAVLRSMLAWLTLWISLLLGYIQFGMLATANGRTNGLLGLVIFGALAVMLLIIIVVCVRMFVTVRRLIKP